MSKTLKTAMKPSFPFSQSTPSPKSGGVFLYADIGIVGDEIQVYELCRPGTSVTSPWKSQLPKSMKTSDKKYKVASDFESDETGRLKYFNEHTLARDFAAWVQVQYPEDTVYIMGENTKASTSSKHKGKLSRKKLMLKKTLFRFDAETSSLVIESDDYNRVFDEIKNGIRKPNVRIIANFFACPSNWNAVTNNYSHTPKKRAMSHRGFRQTIQAYGLTDRYIDTPPAYHDEFMLHFSAKWKAFFALTTSPSYFSKEANPLPVSSFIPQTVLVNQFKEPSNITADVEAVFSDPETVLIAKAGTGDSCTKGKGVSVIQDRSILLQKMTADPTLIQAACLHSISSLEGKHFRATHRVFVFIPSDPCEPVRFVGGYTKFSSDPVDVSKPCTDSSVISKMQGDAVEHRFEPGFPSAKCIQNIESFFASLSHHYGLLEREWHESPDDTDAMSFDFHAHSAARLASRDVFFKQAGRSVTGKRGVTLAELSGIPAKPSTDGVSAKRKGSGSHDRVSTLKRTSMFSAPDLSVEDTAEKGGFSLDI